MKTFLEQFNRIPKLAYIIMAVSLVLISSVPIIFFLIMPGVEELGRVNQEIESQKIKLEEVKKSIAFLSSQNKENLEGYTEFFNQLIPGQLDMLHFASLNELVASSAGAVVEKIIISKGLDPSTTTTTPPPPATPAATAPTTTPAVQTAPTTITITYRSSYDSLLSMIDIWTKADQLVGVSLVKTVGQPDGVLNYTIDYTLPVFSADTKATISDRIQFSPADKEKLDDLRSKIIYFATPSAQPVGKNNPFR